jgi:hypothetical protein
MYMYIILQLSASGRAVQGISRNNTKPQFGTKLFDSSNPIAPDIRTWRSAVALFSPIGVALEEVAQCVSSIEAGPELGTFVQPFVNPSGRTLGRALARQDITHISLHLS